MDEFINTLDRVRFESTNALWNRLTLNSPWSIGVVAEIILMQEFTAKEDWEDYYYASGISREDLISSDYPEYRAILNDPFFPNGNQDQFSKLPSPLKDLNFYHGRTRAQIDERGAILFSELIKTGNRYALTREECNEYARFRVICQAWNDRVNREINTIESLTGRFATVTFRKTDEDTDCNFAVDYEILCPDGTLVCGLLLKPESYDSNKAHIVAAREANARKHALYLNATGKPVINVIAKNDGIVMDPDVINSIRQSLIRAGCLNA
jgi:hypothetical protein